MPNYNPFTSVQVSIQGETVTIQYRVDSTFDGKAPYRFEVQAFEDNTLSAPLYTISSTTFFATDNRNVRQNVRPSFLYRVKLTTDDNKIYYSNFTGWSPDSHMDLRKYLTASEISRREQVRFNYAGMYVYLLKRKSYSPKATNEIDPVTGEPIVDTSEGSFGVGLTDGYYPPVLARLSIEGRNIKEDYQEQGHGTSRIEIVSTRSVGFPFIEQHDLIVMCDGKRYIVVDPGNKLFPGTTLILLQLSTMQLIPITDSVYHIEVPAFPNEQ